MGELTALQADLERLAANVRWAWTAAARELFEQLDPVGWRRSHRNPVALLADLDVRRWAAAAAQPAFVARVRDAVTELDRYLDDQDTWYAREGGDPQRTVVYLSAEYGVADGLDIYSGGLGVLAGDHLRSASDLGVPLVAVGLAYRHGYFRQHLDATGWQQEEPAVNDLERAPARLVVDDAGRPVEVTVEMGDGDVAMRAWRVDVGRVPLYLLDTEVVDNDDHHRAITGQLYGGDDDMRLRQELVLGVGGMRLLDALGVDAHVVHLNEGHAAFAGIELLRRNLDDGTAFEDAVERVRDRIVFTTHTPVPAGHDVFDGGLASWHLGPLAERSGVAFETLWRLACPPGDNWWSQTVLALALARRTNGVARLHGEVSRRMWSRLWPDRPVDEVPIGHVTNGVHPAMWVGEELAQLFDRVLGTGWRTSDDPALWERIREVDLEELWWAHTAARWRLIADARARLRSQSRRYGLGPDGRGLDPDALTIGFARRFATYKRATLLAHDLDRLTGIVASDERPVQILVAGKAHPRDEGGKQLIQQLVGLTRDPRLRGRVAFLEGYDLDLARRLVTGVDVWLNNPLRPMEASGTSGMKAAMNGVLNLSVLDGWWDEAVADLASQAHEGFGWAIGDRQEGDDRAARDAADAHALYVLLEQQVVPTFYERDRGDVPERWVTSMQDAIAVLAPRFSTHRMVSEYAARAYAAEGVRPRS